MVDKVRQSLTVLVVDDEALLRWALGEVLRQGGHVVLEASSAGDARDAIAHASQSIDIVLLDYQLPDSHDLRLLHEVRHRLPGCAVVMMTTFGTPEMTRDAISSGAYRVLSKPFGLENVENLIADAHRATRTAR